MSTLHRCIARIFRVGVLCSLPTTFIAVAQNPPSAIIRIDAGGSAIGSWSADQDFTVSSASTTAAAIATTLVPNPAPQSVYQSERKGVFTYTIPNLTAGVTYPVVLHFAEIDFTTPGSRQFNVLINSVQVLTNFDIAAQAGGANVALARQFQATASPAGTITIQFIKGDVDQPTVGGIEVLPPNPPQGALSSGKVYTLTSNATGQALDDDNTTTPGGVVTQWSLAAGNTNQQWQINALGNGRFNLVSLSNGMALDNVGSVTAGTAVAQNLPAITASSQQWTITQVATGEYSLVNGASGMALDTGGASGNGGSIIQSTPTNGSSQIWNITPVQIGANTPFTSYEAEAGSLAGGATVVSLSVPPTTTASSPQLEASGRAFVQLAATGQSVSWTNTTGQAITAINVRYSIPDAPSGGGITSTLDLSVNGTFRQALSVNSKQTWIYEMPGSDGQSKSPSDGVPHKFWDETHAFITGAAVEPGGTITLTKDASNSAAFYDVDVVDLETPPPPIAQPANSISILSCGAVANNINADNSGPLQTCINNAQSSQGKTPTVWIPQGTFYLNTPINQQPTGITIAGAGMWYSTLYYNPAFPYDQHGNVINPYSTSILNLHLDGNATNNTQDAYMLNVKGDNWVIDGVWLEHEGPGIWADGSNGIVENSRFDSLWADGINLNNGSGDTGNNGGTNLTAINNFVRGSGDDGIAINDSEVNCQQNMVSTTVISNTVVAPWWANNIGVYGGTLDLVANNLITDSVRENGIGIGVYGPTGGKLQTAFISGNTVLRGGSFGYGFHYPAIEMGGSGDGTIVNNVILRGNSVINPMFSGILVNSVINTEVFNNSIDAASLSGIIVNPGDGEGNDSSPAQGNASFINNTVFNERTGQSAYSLTVPGFSSSQQTNVGPIYP